MSFDETFLGELIEALAEVGLEAIIIGNAAAILHGVPVLTHDVDLLVREHPRLEEKLRKFAAKFNVTLTKPFEPASNIIRAVGRPVGVDFVVDLSSGESFESTRSRAARVRIGRRTALVASLEDVIASKEAAGRPKDRAVLQMLKDALRVGNAMRKRKGRRGR